MKISNLLIGLVLFSAMIAGGSVIIGQFDTAYENANMTGNWNSTYNKISTISTTTDKMYNDTSTATVKDTAIVWLPSAIWRTVITSVQSIWLSTDIVMHIGEDFGIPGWFITTVVTIIILSMIFAVATAIFRRNV